MNEICQFSTRKQEQTIDYNLCKNASGKIIQRDINVPQVTDVLA